MSQKGRRTAAERPAEGRWRDLTWNDLEAWAGARSLQRGRSYQRSGRVRQLARSADGTLLAWVHGQLRYATRVELAAEPPDGPALASRCTCPLGISGCKHAVAVVVAYLDALKKGEAVPAAGENDSRWTLLDGDEDDEARADDFGDDEHDDAEDEAGDWDETPSPRRRRGKRAPARQDAIRAYLEGMSVAELAAFVLQLAERYPEVGEELATRAAPARGKTGDPVRQARKEIARLTAQQVWYDRWHGEGNLPDYRGLQSLFAQLLENGQIDALLELGETLFTEGNRQIGEANDEGETAAAIADCMDVVFRAVPASGRPDAEKLLYVCNKKVDDEYEISRGADALLEKEWSSEAWSAVADELAGCLPALTVSEGGDDFTGRYRRDRLSDWVILALRRAGREAEVLPLCEAEARVTGSYERLVKELIAAGRLDDAGRWAREGIERVGARYPGIANHLQDHLREIAERRKDWPAVAAIRAEEFFGRPTVAALKTLEKAAAKAGCGPQARAAALHFLETGVRPAPAPDSAAPTRSRRPTGRRPAVERATAEERGPHLEVLLDLAVEEKRPDDVLRWYDRIVARRQASRYGSAGDHLAGRVADAVAVAQPDRALTLYRKVVESQIALTSPSAYDAALPYLRKVRDLLRRLGRDAEWPRYLGEIRDANRRKRRLLEALDRLESRPIVDG